MIGRVLGPALVTMLLVSGCTSPRADVAAAPSPSDVPPSPAPPRTPARDAPTFVGPDSPLVQRLWRPVGELRRLRTVLPARLDFDVVQSAPPLTDAPIETAVLAVGREPVDDGWGDAVVMSPGGEWRRVERDDLGMRDPEKRDLQFELSPDGRTLALGDEHGIVFVDLATARAERLPTSAAEPVLHWWSPDSSRLVFTPRSNPSVTWEADVAGRTVTRMPFDAWAGSVGPGGRVVELGPVTAGPGRPQRAASFAGLRQWDGDRLVGTVPLGVGVSQDSRTGRQWARHVAIAQGRAPRGRPPRVTGVLALDPTDGRPVGLLDMTWRHLEWWASSPGSMGRWLLLEVASDEGSRLVAWDPTTARLRAVMEVEEYPVILGLASALLRRRPWNHVHLRRGPTSPSR